jgi:hypothetical protein
MIDVHLLSAPIVLRIYRKNGIDPSFPSSFPSNLSTLPPTNYLPLPTFLSYTEASQII